MGLLGFLARNYLLNRLLRGHRRDAPSARRGAARPPRRFPGPTGAGHRGRVGFFGPVPHYTATTRRGTRVSVGGCCLPLPLMAAAATAAAAAVATRQHVRYGPRS
jgi:hypothetical protein